ncbi:hypothetical protein AAG570_012637 [Ranatra chinensis]|uniref:Rab-GAP TBC domain-containing protein n=1 Tax=Ranatra chinensis TaxID=642074 RepID=A0ABD0YEG1_9HEMI
MVSCCDRISPRKELKSNTLAPSTSSFQDFQRSVNDAWDLGDDEFCNISSIKISKRVSQSAADSVISHHKIKPIECVHRGTEKQVELDKAQTSIQKDLDLDRSKIIKFQNLLTAPFLNLEDLQKLSFPGIPFPIKADAWRLLSHFSLQGYAPPSLTLRNETLNQKRLDYWNFVKEYYDSESRDETYQGTYRQIHIDIPRMSPTIGLFRQKIVQEMFERILFIWSVMHPASGYVQGINDLVTPFYIVFLQQVTPEGTDLDSLDVKTLKNEERDIIEADSYWCFCKFLDGIQDNYIFPQLGIQHKIHQLKELIQRIDGDLHKHLQSNGVEYLQFSFRWMNNLLTRELPLRCLIRLWDTYLAELDTFASFQLFVCAAFLLHWRKDLILEKDFQGLMLMLQNLPTQNWDDSNIAVLVAEAYKLKFTFADAPNHFQSKGS